MTLKSATESFPFSSTRISCHCTAEGPRPFPVTCACHFDPCHSNAGELTTCDPGKIDPPINSDYANSKLSQIEPGNMNFSIYQSYLDQLAIEISLGDYIGYYETEDTVRYYTVVNDGRITSDNKHTYGGYKKFYRTIIATPSTNNEFKGI